MNRDAPPIVSTSIKDCEVQTFRSGGKGGQNQNKRDTGVRVIHRASGARGESRDERSQLANKRLAFRRMAESAAYQRWVHLEVARRTGDLDRQVRDAMRSENIKTEYFTPTGAAT